MASLNSYLTGQTGTSSDPTSTFTPTVYQGGSGAGTVIDPSASVGGSASPSYDPGLALPTLSTTPYSLANDPTVLLALNMYKQGQSTLAAQYALKTAVAPAPYTGDGGVANAKLALQVAQQNAQATAQQQAHQLPLTLLGIVNNLAAHGLGYSGDATFEPDEAVYNYNTGLQSLFQDLSAKKAQISIDQSQAAAQAAAANAQYQFEKQQQLAEAVEWKLEDQQGLKDKLASALSDAFTNAVQDGSLAYSSSAGTSVIPPDILALLTG